MEPRKLQYSLSDQEVNYILNALNRTQISGFQQAQDLIAIIGKLQTPDNMKDLEKDQLEQLKSKYEEKK